MVKYKLSEGGCCVFVASAQRQSECAAWHTFTQGPIENLLSVWPKKMEARTTREARNWGKILYKRDAEKERPGLYITSVYILDTKQSVNSPDNKTLQLICPQQVEQSLVWV